MTLNLVVAESAIFDVRPIPVACRDVPADLPACQAFEIDLLKPGFYTFTIERVEKLRKTFKEMPDQNGPYVWTHRALTTAYSCPIIRFVNFISKNPIDAQYPHVERLKDENVCRKVFYHSGLGLHYILPVEEATVFDLSKTTIEKSLSEIEKSVQLRRYRSRIEEVLNYCVQDPIMKGIALSWDIKTKNETFLATFVWIKA